MLLASENILEILNEESFAFFSTAFLYLFQSIYMRNKFSEIVLHLNTTYEDTIRGDFIVFPEVDA